MDRKVYASCGHLCENSLTEQWGEKVIEYPDWGNPDLEERSVNWGRYCPRCSQKRADDPDWISTEEEAEAWLWKM